MAEWIRYEIESPRNGDKYQMRTRVAAREPSFGGAEIEELWEDGVWRPIPMSMYGMADEARRLLSLGRCA
jgi:hypothetical protein